MSKTNINGKLIHVHCNLMVDLQIAVQLENKIFDQDDCCKADKFQNKKITILLILYFNCFRNMIRRSPTRIDLRLDDLAEYETLKKERDALREAEKIIGPFNPAAWKGKLSTNEIQERIGYVPQTPQTTHPRPNITL